MKRNPKNQKSRKRVLKELDGGVLKDDRWFGEHIEELVKEHAGEDVAVIDQNSRKRDGEDVGLKCR